jgi:hypothetical protein
MGKRPDFPRRARDEFSTPVAAAVPLIPWLKHHGVRRFAEPCAFDGALVRHLESHGLVCAYRGDISAGQDAHTLGRFPGDVVVISNPPFGRASRAVLCQLIVHFQNIAPAGPWLLLPLDLSATKYAAPLLPACSDIVPIGRVRWVEGYQPGESCLAQVHGRPRGGAGPSPAGVGTRGIVMA